MYEEEARLAVHLWIDAQLKPLNNRGVFYYIQQRGERNTGTILLKVNGLSGECHLLTQQRDLDGKLGWVNALRKELVEESDADQYIQRAISRDPDLWVIEIEDRKMVNPFEGDLLQ
ncbi:MAG: hypothetical protein COA45_11125 [Zetaproteobacteria bacterium]|nr:MAG: hypothetical protein COA45_11125 [Zetaproteobacteria bacterium]